MRGAAPVLYGDTEPLVLPSPCAGWTLFLFVAVLVLLFAGLLGWRVVRARTFKPRRYA